MGKYFHNNSLPLSPPPQLPKFLPVVEKSKVLYQKWMAVHRNIERTARFGLGTKIDTLFLHLLELLRKATFTPFAQKIPLLEEASERVDSLRFFLQILYENRFVVSEQYIALAGELESVGRDVGSWKRGIIEKTSAQGAKPKAEERKQ